MEIDLLLTNHECAVLERYFNVNGLGSKGIKLLNCGTVYLQYKRNTYVGLNKYKFSYGEDVSAKLLINNNNSYIDSSSITPVTNLNSRSKLILTSGGAYLNFSSLTLPKHVLGFFNKITQIYQMRGNKQYDNIFIPSKLLTELSIAHLNKFYYIDSDLDAINSTNRFLFSYCLFSNMRNYKFQYWKNHLDSVFSMNNTHYQNSLTRKELVPYCDSNEFIKNVELDLFGGIKGIEFNNIKQSNKPIDNFYNVIVTMVSVRHVPTSNASCFEITFKSNDGYLVKVHSNNEFRGNNLSKSDCLNFINNKVLLELSGSIIKQEPELYIGGRMLRPPTLFLASNSLYLTKHEFNFRPTQPLNDKSNIRL